MAAAHPTSLRVLGHVGDCRPCSVGIWRQPSELARCLGLHAVVWPNIMVTSPEGCPTALRGGHVPPPSPNWTVLWGRVTRSHRGRPDVAFGLMWVLFSHPQFPMGPGSDGPMGGMGGMEPHHMNGSLGERPASPRGFQTLGEKWKGGAGQEGAGAAGAPSTRLFSFCPHATGSGDIDGLPKVSELLGSCVSPLLSPGLGWGRERGRRGHVPAPWCSGDAGTCSPPPRFVFCRILQTT